MARKTKTVSFTGNPSLTVGDLKEFLGELVILNADDEQRINITQYKGDQRDPGSTTMSATIDL